ncbi:MAG: RpiB/LacA/LacB family sugar-phosphate isomerase [Arenicellales bacterium]|nr:RpiB/LacA/LacB family sugar-phosphate isomerase [Arenicellales bacterium]
MQIGIAADHGGFGLKEQLTLWLRDAGHAVEDFGAHQLNIQDDYPDYIVPLARSVASGKNDRGIAVCGSGVGASVAANKIDGIRCGLCHDHFSSRQGVEDDHMNIVCLGGRVIGVELAWDVVTAFLSAEFSGAERHRRRLGKVAALEES